MARYEKKQIIQPDTPITEEVVEKVATPAASIDEVKPEIAVEEVEKQETNTDEIKIKEVKAKPVKKPTKANVQTLADFLF